MFSTSEFERKGERMNCPDAHRCDEMLERWQYHVWCCDSRNVQRWRECYRFIERNPRPKKIPSEWLVVYREE